MRAAFGTTVEVVSPPEPREELGRTAAEIAALYGAERHEPSPRAGT
ncbi:hypothetical protein ABT173_49045 [Streptomyces sp. NPDC001795]